ncbi:MAG: thioredoxin domain-containing protein [Bacteroidia bacterium]|nr:thioredoxin domain-containing protein [Bacteroidia bacterium]
MKYLFFAILALLFVACQSAPPKSNAIAYVDGEPISISQIDHIVEGDIYSHAIAMYEIRKSVLDSHVEYVVLNNEAKKRGLSISQMIDSLVGLSDNISDSQLNQANNQIVDSLLALHKVDILLKEPLAPRVNIDSAFHINIANSNSPVKITLIADASCNSCHEVYPIVISLLKNYDEAVTCQYVNFSLEPTIYAKALMLADEYGRAPEVLDTLMSCSSTPDSLALMSILASYDIDTSIFQNKQLAAELQQVVYSNNAYISHKGIDKTPTLLINGRPVRNPFDYDRICAMVNRALSDTYQHQ